MKGPLLILVVLFIALLSCFSVYRSTSFASYRIEQIRLTLDNMSQKAFIQKNRIFLFINMSVFGNGDKYAYRPPRLVPTFTLQGARAYEVFGVVTHWDSNARILEVNSYIHKKLFIRFDPSLDGSVAYVPHLDNQGAVVDFRDNDFVYDTSTEKFDHLFCPDDIVSVRIKDPQEIRDVSAQHPVVPKEIFLSHRLCKQENQ